MTTTMKNSFTMSMSIKIILISTTILLLATTFPRLITAATSELPAMLTAAKSWLRPPYLYFIINGIIITIVASSRLHHHHHHASLSPESDPHALPSPAPVVTQNVISVRDVGVVEVEEEEVKEVMTSWVSKPFFEEEEEETVAAAAVVEGWSLPPAIPPRSPLVRQEAVAGLISERQPAVSRIGHHRRPTKASLADGGKALRRVAKPKKHDTLESTWKAITEGRHIPLARHHKRSGTWASSDRQINLLDSSPTPEVKKSQINLLDSSPTPEVKKSQTFTDRSNHTVPPPVQPSTVKLRKEPSLGQDELNRRVEAFINKFNEDMKLQRQQSMQQFMEMINRAT